MSIEENDEEYEQDKLRATLESLGTLDQYDSILKQYNIAKVGGREGQDQLFRVFVQSLREDMVDCLDAAELETLHRTDMRFLDLGDVNAMCADADRFNQRLPFFLIFLNQGLFYCLKLLFTAQVMEDLRGDLKDFRQDGAGYFELAIRLFETRDINCINEGRVKFGQSEIDGEIDAHISRASTMVMTFIALHELGHAHLGHHAILRRNRMCALGEQQIPESVSIDAQNAEFEADAFAMRGLMRRNESPLGRWANLYAIRLFFWMLDIIEARSKDTIFWDHPPSMARAQRLTELVAETTSQPADMVEDFARQERMFETLRARLAR